MRFLKQYFSLVSKPFYMLGLFICIAILMCIVFSLPIILGYHTESIILVILSLLFFSFPMFGFMMESVNLDNIIEYLIKGFEE